MTVYRDLQGRYTEVLTKYGWLKLTEELVTDAYISDGLKIKLEQLNQQKNVGYHEVAGLKSGRDVVSGYTWYDIRKRVGKHTIHTTERLFKLDKHRLLMLRWVCRGASVYVAFCKVMETDPYTELSV